VITLNTRQTADVASTIADRAEKGKKDPKKEITEL
jgi:hypothetical protein